MRQEEILERVAAGEVEIPPLVPVGTLGIEVWADALRIDGVRVGVSARTAQAIADTLGLSPTTPQLEDLIWTAVPEAWRVPPFPQPPTLYDIRSWDAQRRHSEQIDAWLALHGVPAGTLIGTVGKAWVISDALGSAGALARHAACNYGWHGKGAPYPAATAACPGHVWQTPGTVHNADHYDYSQTLRLAWLGGQPLPGTRLDRLHDNAPR